MPKVKIIYDVQENYDRNIPDNSYLVFLLKSIKF